MQLSMAHGLTGNVAYLRAKVRKMIQDEDDLFELDTAWSNCQFRFESNPRWTFSTQHSFSFPETQKICLSVQTRHQR